jgi:septum formation topological specificity factor MinE
MASFLSFAGRKEKTAVKQRAAAARPSWRTSAWATTPKPDYLEDLQRDLIAVIAAIKINLTTSSVLTARTTRRAGSQDRVA